MIQVDLRAPTIPNSQRVWRLFPGGGYQFLDSFDEQHVGFLDFPGLELPRGKLADAKDWIPRIAFSLDLKNQLLSDGPEVVPDKRLKDFANARATQNRGRLRQAIINFYEVAAKGDFVVLPEPVYLSNIWVGRIASADVTSAYFKRRYGKNKIPARTINWLGKYQENTISTELSQSLRQAHPFTLLERSRHIEVFSLSYGSFVYDDRHAETIYNDKNDFLDSDAALLGAISRLAAAACMAQDKKNLDLSSEDLADILLRSPPIEYTCTQEADIHSPGFNRYIAGTTVALIIAAVAGSLIGLSHFSSKDALAEDLPKLTVINTAPDADPLCTARVSDASAKVLKALGTDRTWALCEAAKAASKRAGLRSSAVPKKKQ
jgi:hypothetical protein